MNNRHEIKSLQDILRAVNADNFENFTKDLTNFIGVWVANRAVIELVAPESLERSIESAEFVWIDDGKNEAKVTIQVVQE